MNKYVHLSPFNALIRFTCEFSIQNYLHDIYLITNQSKKTYQSGSDFFFYVSWHNTELILLINLERKLWKLVTRIKNQILRK